MKNKFTYLLIAGLLMSVAVTGCKHPQRMTTILPNRTPQPPRDPGQGGMLGGGTGLTEMPQPTGIPFNPEPGHPNWPENPEFFKANTVHFAFDSSSIRSEEKSKIASVADYLKGNMQNAVRVDGHCDERGTEEYNRSLGERRALGIREELVSLGIDPTRVDTRTYGEDRPADSGHDESAWKQNRRGEFILLTPPR